MKNNVNNNVLSYCLLKSTFLVHLNRIKSHMMDMWQRPGKIQGENLKMKERSSLTALQFRCCGLVVDALDF